MKRLKNRYLILRWAGLPADFAWDLAKRDGNGDSHSTLATCLRIGAKLRRERTK